MTRPVSRELAGAAGRRRWGGRSPDRGFGWLKLARRGAGPRRSARRDDSGGVSGSCLVLRRPRSLCLLFLQQQRALCGCDDCRPGRALIERGEGRIRILFAVLFEGPRESQLRLPIGRLQHFRRKAARRVLTIHPRRRRHDKTTRKTQHAGRILAKLVLLLFNSSKRKPLIRGPSLDGCIASSDSKPPSKLEKDSALGH